MNVKTRCVKAAAVASVAAVVLAGCASTSIRSQMDPQLRGHVYRKVMVFVDFKDLGLRQDAEHQFQVSLGAHGTEVVRSVDVFVPGRAYATDEMARILREAGIEAVLVASSGSAGTSSTWIPPTTTTQGTATVTGNTVAGSSTSTTSGGYSVNKPWAQFRAALHDISSDKVVWIASMSSGGNAFAGWDDLARSMAKKTSEQLSKDGVVK